MLAIATIESRDVNREYDVEFPQIGKVIYTDNPRAAVVAKFRELANKLESGELNGASCYWNDHEDQPHVHYTECDPKSFGEKRQARSFVCSFAPFSERPIRLVQEQE